MKLLQGWHNTDLGRSYFHYGPFGGTKKQMGILAQTCTKRGVKSMGKKSGKWKKSQVGGFLSNSSTKKQMGILAQTCTKRGVKSNGEKSGKWKKAKWEVF